MHCRCYEPRWNEHIYEDVAGIDAALLENEIIYKSIFLKSRISIKCIFIYLLMWSIYLMYLDLHVSTYLDNIGIEKFWKIESLKLKKSIRSRFGLIWGIIFLKLDQTIWCVTRWRVKELTEKKKKSKKIVENIWNNLIRIILICNIYEASVYFAYWNRDENIFSNVNIIPWKIEIRRR